MTGTAQRVSVALLAVAGLAVGAWVLVRERASGPPSPPRDTETPAAEASPTHLAPDPRARTSESEPPSEWLDEDDTYQLPDRPDPPDPTAPATLHLLVTLPAETSPTAVRVRVVDSAGRAHEATPSADGAAVLAGLAPGSATVRAEAPELVCAFLPDLWLEPGADVRQECELLPGVHIEGRVVARATREPIVGALVEFGPDRGRYGAVTTDGDGRYRSPPLPAGEASTVEVRARGYSPGAHTEFEVGRVAEPAEILLQPGGILRGVVTAPDGTPRRDALVSVHEVDGADEGAPRAAMELTDKHRQLGREAMSDAAGRFEFEGLPIGVSLCVVASDSTLAPSEEACGIRLSVSAPEAECALTLRHGGSAEVRLLDPDGVLLRRVTVTVATRGAERTGEVGADSTVVLEGLAPGPAVLRVEAFGFVTLRQRIDIPAGTRWKGEVTLSRDVTIEGVVVDEEGRPVPNAMIELWQASSGNRSQSVTDGQGKFRIGGLEPGPCQLTARAAGVTGPFAPDLVGLLEATAPDAAIRLVMQGSKPTPVTVRFLEPGGGPVGRLLVRATARAPRSWLELRDVRIDGSGATRTWSLHPGRWELLAHFEGLVPWVREIEIVGSEPIDLGEVRLEEGVSLEGVVVDGAGNPVPEGFVEWSDGHEGSTQTGSDGRFRLEALPRREVSIAVYHEDFVTGKVRIDLRQSQPPLRVQLARGARVTLQVRAPAGVAIPDQLGWRMSRLEPGHTEPPDDGWFVDGDEAVLRVAAGRYRFELRLGDPRLAHEDVLLEEGRDVTVTLRLPGP